MLLVLLVAWGAYVRFDIAMEMKERRLQVEQEASLLQARKDDLQKQVEYLSNERGIEAEMRRQFDVALEGEQVVVILEDEGPEVLPLTGTTTEETIKRWYQFWR